MGDSRRKRNGKRRVRMADRPSIRAEARTALGKKVRALRRQGVTPANLVVPRGESVALQVNEREIVTLIKSVGQTGLVDLELDGGTQLVLVGDLDIDRVAQRLRHVAFRHLEMDRTIDVAVPIEFVGAAPADQAGDRFAVHEMQELMVRCLPAFLPREIQVDVSGLDVVGDAVRVGDLTPPEGVEFLDERFDIVANVQRERAEAEVEGVEAAAAAVAEGPAAGAGAPAAPESEGKTS